jgi:hypothetical protein
MLLENAPYLSRDNWQWTPDHFGLTDGDTIEIRVAFQDDMDYSKPDDWDSDEEWKRRAHKEDMKTARREADRHDRRDRSDRNFDDRDYPNADDDQTRERRALLRPTPTTRRTQPRSGLCNVLSQLETINVSSKRDETVTGALESSNGSNRAKGTHF